MSLENTICPNFIRDVEQMHTDLNKDRHRNETGISPVYEMYLKDIASRNNVPDIDYIHYYYIGRYHFDWRTNKSVDSYVSTPGFLLREQV